ncbi:hypothetical protein CSB45_00345 [candidate division KSB3 bacterium]|uniref:Outer membrane lipoprotein BamD-like domain-containing protein n=1 Tax=candidate division KSB3 bacterium TaxID=2044937 RepID=A0A2G6EFB9_9BACT|nr:MAG: hypothetical protein CSB45_00345 [candidate division KSB3 bacterium]PIE28392.1 MAG: hypothetical protein CSA57_14195 [candidate division KSB3 bacterium]
MKRICVKLDKISESDLQFAKSPRVVALLDEIIALPAEERARQLEDLQQKIDSGEADLFEEHVKSRLLKPQGAEWIQLLHKNAAVIEQKLQKRCLSPPPAFLRSPQSASSTDAQCRRDSAQTQSELLEFLASQKPRKASVPVNRSRTAQVEPENSPAVLTLRESVVTALLLFVLASSISFVLLSKKKSSEALLTFREQEQSSAARQARLLDEKVQEEFDSAARELRFGDFERGKAQLSALAERFPESVYAENAYISIADMLRLRKRDADFALRIYQDFLERWPQSSQVDLVRLKMGLACEDLEDFSSAEAVYRLLLATARENGRIRQLARQRLRRLQEHSF